MFCTILLVLALFGPSISKPSHKTTDDYCYITDDEPYLYFCSKTAYEYTHGDLNENVVPETCTAIQFWSLNRHGTRYAGASDLRNFANLGSLLNQVVTNYEEERSTLCQEDFDLLETWEWDESIVPSMANDLIEQGFKDLSGIAERYKQKFPELFVIPYSQENYFFQFTETERTKDSFDAYVEGLFGSTDGVEYTQSNEVIKVYESCSTWNDDREDKEEYEKFLQTSVYQEMLQRVSQRLGFTETLNSSTIEIIYAICAYEKSWYVNETSKWCTAFTKEDLKVLEYGEDLQYHYKSGYGREEANKAISCPILNDLFSRFQNTVNGLADEPKVAVYFSHSTALHTFMVGLGLYKDDEELTADNYEQQSDRKWRSSIFGPFATNVAAILYNCSDTEDPYQIEVLIGERPKVVCSGNSTLCSWSKFVDEFEESVQSCSLDFCEADVVESLSAKLSLQWVCFCIVLLHIILTHTN